MRQQTIRVTDLDSRRLQGLIRGSQVVDTLDFHLVFPHLADASAGKVSVLALLGMAVLGRNVGELVSWQAPAGVRRLRVDDVLYQAEREGRDIA